MCVTLVTFKKKKKSLTLFSPRVLKRLYSSVSLCSTDCEHVFTVFVFTLDLCIWHCTLNSHVSNICCCAFLIQNDRSLPDPP